MTKLTKAQRRLLLELADGWILEALHFSNRTKNILIEKGFIALTPRGTVITEKGREAMTE